MNIKELAEKIGATAIEGASGDEEITCVTGIEDGAPGAVTFVGNAIYERFLATTQATAVIVSEHQSLPAQHPAILRAKSPYEAFARALEIFSATSQRVVGGDSAAHPGSIHPTAIIDPSAQIHPTAQIGTHVSVGANVKIGAMTALRHGAFVGPDTQIGEHCVIHPNAVIYDRTQIGDRVVIGAGSVIGFDGFGYVPMADGSYRKIPQIGIVVLEDDVEIGANTTIDRATVAQTRVGKGVKIDNLVQIGHNVEVGEHTVMAAQAGVSGSTKIGRFNMLAGQAGITGHIQTADRVTISAQAGLSKSVTEPGIYMGSPASPGREALKREGRVRALPELLERVTKLEEKLQGMLTQ